MSRNITVTFIGTTSGGGPSETRNCSSLVVDPLANGSLWMVDCAEGTVRQFEQQPYRAGQPRMRMSQVSKIFITHMHADHTMGTLTFLRNVLGIPKLFPPSTTPPNARLPRVEIFGPRGIRRMLRMLWHTTHTHSEFSFVVHELLFPGEHPSVPAEVKSDEEGANEVDVRRESECIGKDFWCDEQGFWRGIVDISPREGRNIWGAVVDAGPIQHRDPCIGYVIREIPRNALTANSAVPRKLVILGDTYDPSQMIPLIHDDPPALTSALPEVDPYSNGVRVQVPVTLLVHEATDAYLPPHVDPQQRTGRNRTSESVTERTMARGHSTPAMAGVFARRIAAERLVMNHIGARFPAADMEHPHGGRNQFRLACMREIENQAAEAWNARRRMQPQAAWDFLSISLPPNQSREWEPTPAPAHSQGRSSTNAVTGAAGITGQTVATASGVEAVDVDGGGGSSSQHGTVRPVPLTEDNLSHVVDARDHRHRAEHDHKRRAPTTNSSSSGGARGRGQGQGRGSNRHAGEGVARAVNGNGNESRIERQHRVDDGSGRGRYKDKRSRKNRDRDRDRDGRGERSGTHR